MLGGSLTILVYVTVAILLTLRRPLLIMNSKDQMLKYLQQVGPMFYPKGETIVLPMVLMLKCLLVFFFVILILDTKLYLSHF